MRDAGTIQRASMEATAFRQVNPPRAGGSSGVGELPFQGPFVHECRGPLLPLEG